MNSEAQGNQSPDRWGLQGQGREEWGAGKGYIKKGNMFWWVREMQKEEKVFQDKSSVIIAHPFINNIANKTWGIFCSRWPRLYAHKIRSLIWYCFCVSTSMFTLQIHLNVLPSAPSFFESLASYCMSALSNQNEGQYVAKKSLWEFSWHITSV